MKIAIITDTHFGGRRGNKVFHDFFQKFYDNIFFPELEKRGIKYCIHMGDAFDNRKNIDYWSLDWAKEHVYDKFKNLGVKVWQLVGNHDVYYKNTNNINSIDLLLESYDNIVPISSPDTYDINGFKAMMLPWICDDNYQETLAAIEKSDAKMAFSHLELNGFEAIPGHVMDHGDDPSIFEKFNLVCSGHFHMKSRRGNVNYLGNPYQLYWGDYGQQRGFHVLNTDTTKLTFLPNPYNIFQKVYYDDTQKIKLPTNLKGSFVKLVVEKKTDQEFFDIMVHNLQQMGCADLKIVEDLTVDLDDVDEAIETEDTLTTLERCVADLENKDDIFAILKSLYLEAQQ